MEHLSFDEIKKKAGESWALIYDTVYSECGELLHGNLVGYGAKKAMIELDLTIEEPHRSATIKWCGGERSCNIDLLNYCVIEENGKNVLAPCPWATEYKDTEE